MVSEGLQDLVDKGYGFWGPKHFEFTEAYHKHNNDCRALQKKKKNTSKKFIFITIQDFQRRMEDLEKLQSFIRRISYMYDEGFWVIETGGKETDFNVHIHMIVKIKASAKNHKSVMNIKWTSFFNTDLNHKDYYLVKQHRDGPDMVPYDEWLQEKMEYFDNDLKGSHQNTIDLKLRGIF